MGIHLSEPDKLKLKDQLSVTLADYKHFSESDINIVYTSILKVLEANARWNRITHDDLVTLSKRFDKRIPDGDFRTSFGRIMVCRIGTTIDRQYYSETTIVRGWHRELISELRNTHRLNCDAALTRALFDLCQPFILAHKVES